MTWAFCSGFSPWPHLWLHVCLLLLPPCWIWAPTENLWELRQVSCPRGSFPLPKVSSTAERLLLRVSDTCPAVSPQGDTNHIRAFRSVYSSTDLYISGLVSMWVSTGLSKSFQSQPTTLIITLPKGSLSSRGENLVSGRCSLSSPGWGINRMACIHLSLGPQSHPLGHHVCPPTSAEVSLSLTPYGYHVGLRSVTYYFCLHLRSCLSDALPTSAVSLSGSSFVLHQWLLQSKIWICQFPPQYFPLSTYSLPLG